MPDLERETLYSKVKWRLMPLLVLCYVCSFVNRSNIGFAKLQFVRDLGLTDAVYGLGAGIFYAGYMLFEVPSNLYLAKRGVRRTILRIMMLWGIASAALALMRTPLHFYALRVIVGAAEAGLFPGVLLYLTYWVPANRRARFTAIFMLSIALSGIVGAPLAGVIMSAFGNVGGLHGWQWLFIVEGLPSCLLGIIAYRYLSDGPSEASWLTDREREVIRQDLEIERTAATRPVHRSFRVALRDPHFYVLICMAFALFASIGGVSFWLPSIVKESGLTDIRAIGILSAIPYAVGGLAQIAVAKHSDRRLERRWHTAAPAFVAALAWALLPVFGGRPVPALCLLTMATAGTLASMVAFWTMPAALLTGTAVAAGIAVISSVGSVANLISPMIVGWLTTRTGSLAAGQCYFAVATAAGALTMALSGLRRTPVFVARTA